MSDLRLFLNLLSLYEESRKCLSIPSLTEAEKHVLKALYLQHDRMSGLVKLNYDRYVGIEFDSANYSRSQFSKSIQRLEEIGLIERSGGPRASTYRVHTIDRHSRRELERVSRRSFARNPQILALFSAIEASTAQTDSLIRY